MIEAIGITAALGVVMECIDILDQFLNAPLTEYETWQNKIRAEKSAKMSKI